MIRNSAWAASVFKNWCLGKAHSLSISPTFDWFGLAVWGQPFKPNSQAVQGPFAAPLAAINPLVLLLKGGGEAKGLKVAAI